MEKMPLSFTSDIPDRLTLPSICVGRKITSGYFADSNTSLCMRLSRPPFPLSPLGADTTISPSAFPVSGLRRTVPLFNAAAIVRDQASRQRQPRMQLLGLFGRANDALLPAKCHTQELPPHPCLKA